MNVHLTQGYAREGAIASYGALLLKVVVSVLQLPQAFKFLFTGKEVNVPPVTPDGKGTPFGKAAVAAGRFDFTLRA